MRAGDHALQVTGQLHPRRLTSSTKCRPLRIRSVCLCARTLAQQDVNLGRNMPFTKSFAGKEDIFVTLVFKAASAFSKTQKC